jgi:hypothetical protein
MIAKAIKINATIQHGWDKVNWLVYTLTGCSLLGVLISSIYPSAALPGTAISLAASASVYYAIGKAHEKHGDEDGR